MDKFILFKKQAEDISEEIALLQERLQNAKPRRIHIHENYIMREPKDLSLFERLIMLNLVYCNSIIKKDINTDKIDIGSCFTITFVYGDGDAQVKSYQLYDYLDEETINEAIFNGAPTPLLADSRLGKIVMGKEKEFTFNYNDKQRHALAMINEIYELSKTYEKQK